MFRRFQMTSRQQAAVRGMLKFTGNQTAGPHPLAKNVSCNVVQAFSLARFAWVNLHVQLTELADHGNVTVPCLVAWLEIIAVPRPPDCGSLESPQSPCPRTLTE